MSVRVEHSLFEENRRSPSNPTASGGGMQAYFVTHNEINFHECYINFSRNCAQSGGGLYFYSDHEIHAKESNKFNVEVLV